MIFCELDEDSLSKAKLAWEGAAGGEFYVATIDSIIDNHYFGSLKTRPNQPTYFGIEADDELLAMLQIVTSGDGRLKTIKMLDLILAPRMRTSTSDERVKVVTNAIVGIFDASLAIASGGDNIRALKIYGRTQEILGVLRVLSDELADAFDQIGFGVAMEGGWLAFYPLRSDEQ